MSEIYGYSSAVSRGNTADETLMGIRRQIDAQNSLARDNFSRLRTADKQNKIVAQQNIEENKVIDRADEGQEGGKVLSAVNDLTAIRNKGNEVVQGVNKVVSSITAPQSEGGNQDISPDEGKTEIKGDVDLVPEKTDFDSDRLFTTEGAGYDIEGNRGFGTGISTGRPMPSGESGSNYVIRAYPVNQRTASEGISEMIKPIENSVATPIAEDLPKSTSFIKSIGTSGGVLGEGLSGALKGATIVTGAYDAIKDVTGSKGSFSNMNVADKVSNISGIVSGALESAGVGIAATGVGLPVAGAVEVAGLVSGGVGLVSGLIGDISGEKKQQSAVNRMPKISPSAQAPQQSEPAYKSSAQSGQLVQ